MFATPLGRRKAVLALAAGLLSLAAACAPAGQAGGPAAPELVAGQPVPVALLVPAGGGPELAFISESLENAARLAIADLSGVAVDLRVYDTGGRPDGAAAAAAAAVGEGAAVILGPLQAEEANAAAVAVAASGVNVLAFSTNPTVAGGNLFILGPTFRNTADRLARYAGAAGIGTVLVAHGDDLGGVLGRDAIVAAANEAGLTVAGIEAYPLSQEGVAAAAGRVAGALTATGAQALFTTADADDLPALGRALPEAGLPPGTPRLIGITRWDDIPDAAALPALQGGLFAVPDAALTSAFEARYQAAYGAAPHPLAALAYDGVAAIGALAAQGRPQALGRASLTQGQGFRGTAGIFRLLPDGTNARGLAVATVQNGQVVILDPAPSSFAGLGL